ncbi:NUDIX hydrolase [Ectobacillus antri]|jgi:ADP-ribose pyrophosphatase YjhB (NUDIX family)|uniref:NUDIX hydrolase n=1 Tax=Ectobacillus antri TaxID=2486280 RepID=A0ABT6H9K5_9BACI|nr:NUDIX hydrolase [Ectobacillus antri]MDG4658259.1 NUDIX hydrolase [Ectobacillus antri]MDG5755360.1 NUDIX hydrolase [Ectobacillus antri]
MSKRGKVWLGVSGLVITEDGKWLVVKKSYGGLKGVWSLPAGFVDEGETVDQAVQREVLEETGIHTEVKGVIGVRSGVIRNEISDNMIIFSLAPLHERIVIKSDELEDAQFLQPSQFANDETASVLLRYLAQSISAPPFPLRKDMNPGTHFGYTAYHVFLPENRN